MLIVIPVAQLLCYWRFTYGLCILTTFYCGWKRWKINIHESTTFCRKNDKVHSHLVYVFSLAGPSLVSRIWPNCRRNVRKSMLDCFVCSYYTLLPEQLINQSYLASLEYRPNCNVSILKHAFISLSDFMWYLSWFVYWKSNHIVSHWRHYFYYPMKNLLLFATRSKVKCENFLGESMEIFGWILIICSVPALTIDTYFCERILMSKLYIDSVIWSVSLYCLHRLNFFLSRLIGCSDIQLMY